MTYISSTTTAPSKYAAFTLLETLISLIIISVALAMAFPNLSSFLRDSRMNAVVTEFTNALYLARSESIKRAVNVTLCSSTDGIACSESEGWQYGWLVFADSNANASMDSDDSLIRVYHNPNNEFTLIGNTYVDSQIHYLPTGRISVLGGTISVCANDRSELGKNIVLIATGRFRIDTDIACE
jgi:type IV fimbrial biogenesis protein FimT